MRVVGPAGLSIEDAALIDSGADTCAFPLWMMKRFGIRKRRCKKEKFETAGGKAKQWIWDGTLKVEIGGSTFEVDQAIFTDTPIALLGRIDFFERFKVAFDERDLSFSLEAY